MFATQPTNGSVSSKSSDLIPLYYNEDIVIDSVDSLVEKTARDGFFFHHGRWTDSSGNSATSWLSYNGLKLALEGFHYIFHGDSIMRQIFHRLVHHIRGFDTVIEHFYHLDATYTCNRTHDLLVIHESHDTNPIRPSNSVLNPTFTASFKWDPTLDRDFPVPSLPSNVLLVVGLHYWVPHDTAEHKLKKFNSSQTIFVNTPTIFTYDDNHWYHVRRRNEWIRNNSLVYIPLEEMARTGAFQSNYRDPFHYQCGYLTGSESWAGQMERVLVVDNEVQYKSPASGDCRDMINLNIVMLLVRYCHLYTSTYAASLDEDEEKEPMLAG